MKGCLPRALAARVEEFDQIYAIVPTRYATKLPDGALADIAKRIRPYVEGLSAGSLGKLAGFIEDRGLTVVRRRGQGEARGTLFVVTDEWLAANPEISKCPLQPSAIVPARLEAARLVFVLYDPENTARRPGVHGSPGNRQNSRVEVCQTVIERHPRGSAVGAPKHAIAGGPYIQHVRVIGIDDQHVDRCVCVENIAKAIVDR